MSIRDRGRVRHRASAHHNAYEDDLAYIHDAGFGGFAREAAPGLLHLMREYGVHSGTVVDLGCGSGIWAHAVVQAGYEVLGVDLSPAMINLARLRIPDGTFVVGSFLDVDFPRCSAVTAMGECFNYLFDERVDEDAGPLVELLRRIYHALRPGGLLIFDMAEPGRGQGRPMSHYEGDDWAILVRYEEDASQRMLVRHITTFREVEAGCYRRSHETHRLRLYARGEVLTWLCDAGFEARVLDRYGASPFPDAWTGFLARKPPEAP